MATNGHIHHDDHRPSAEPTTESGAAANSGNSNLPKDEVGWYFVEQYYTTLSKSPDKLHLFYGKRSQFVYGQEAELSSVSVGRPAIQERIKNLDFSDCKVRISNVDSQGSGENIVIQVIGETSNKAGEPRKFVQTFVLAQQPSGYFVLNDILRYVNEDDDEAVEAESEPAAPVEIAAAPVVEAEPETETEPEPEAAQEAPVAVEAPEPEEPAELDADVVGKKLEEAVATEEAVSEPAEVAVEPVAEVPEVEAEEKAAPETVPDVEKAVEEIAEEEVKKPENPKAPTPTPAVERAAAPVAAEPVKPKEAPKPMTWASRAAAAAGPTRPVAVVPIPKTATPPAQTRAPAPTATATATAPAPAPATATAQPAATQASDSSPATSVKDQGEWQTAEVKRQNRPQSLSATPLEKEGTMAYIKYVTEKVKDEDLKGLLATFGELAYFDINRQKNCAFVEFKSTSGYNAAIAANPHTVNGESILVEQRRPKANAYGGSNYNSTRGGTPGRGRGGFEAGRGGSQGTGRGGFPGQTRGRGGAPRARGPSSQAGAA